MGYSRNAGIRALIAAKDNVEVAINWIMDNFDNDLDAPLVEEKVGGGGVIHVDLDSMAQIQELGFDDLQARIALIKNVRFCLFIIGWYLY